MSQFDRGFYEDKIRKLQAKSDVACAETLTLKKNIEVYKEAIGQLKNENIGLKNYIQTLKNSILELELRFAKMTESDFGAFQKDFNLWMQTQKEKFEKDKNDNR